MLDKIKKEKGTDFFINHFYQHMFDNVINGIEYIEVLKKELLNLGKHHKNRGIKKEMFDAFISTIVVASNYSTNNTR